MLCAAVIALCLGLQTHSDPSRLVRLFEGIGTPTPDANPYLATPQAGDRMVLGSTASVIADLQALRAYGVDLFLSRSDTLSTPEVGEGTWNWTRAIAEKEAAEQAGGAWGIAVHAAFPNAWQRPALQNSFLVSAEHGTVVPALSPWSPALRPFAERNWQAVALQFGKLPVVIVGVHGQFGDAGLILGMRGLSEGLRARWQSEIGPPVETPSFWCGDEYAKESFSRAMLAKYGGLEELNAAWKSEIETTAPLPFPIGSEFSYAARLDFVRWYLDSVTGMTSLLLDIAKQACPDSMLLLPIGPPDNSPKAGTDISALVREAGKRQATVLLTVGGYHAFARNHMLTLGLARAAARHYRVPLWLQSASPSDAQGFSQRLAEALGLGAAGYLDWSENWARFGEVSANLSRFLTVGAAQTDVAVLYPSSTQYLRPDQAAPPLYLQGATLLREYTDFDVLDERLVQEGALSRYRVAILFEGTVWEEQTLAELERWLEEGGVLLAYDFGKLATPDGRTEAFSRLFPSAATASPAALRDSYDGEIPDCYEIDAADTKQDWLLEGDWFPPDKTDRQPIRYTGATAGFRLPLKEGQDYSITLRCWVPAEAEGFERRVYFEGRLLGKLPRSGEATYRFVIPGNWVTRQVCRLTLQSHTWRFAEQREGSEDLRDIGLGVLGLVVRRADTAEEPRTLSGRFRPLVMPSQIREQWSARVGNGWSIYFPATRARLSDFVEVARLLVHRLSEIDPGRVDAPEIDNRRDGVFASLLSDKVVFFNSGSVPVTKSVKVGEAREAKTVSVAPGSVAVVWLGEEQELLLQCEKFVEPGTAQPIARVDCSPGSGTTALVVPANEPILTRFEIKVPGTYTLFLRTLRGPDTIVPTVLLDEVEIAKPGDGVQEGDVVRLGEVHLDEGVHTLVLQDVAAFTADFVIFSTLPKLKGYRFGSK